MSPQKHLIKALLDKYLRQGRTNEGTGGVRSVRRGFPNAEDAAAGIYTTKHIIITGGGTGGHVFPALAIAEELKRRGFAVSFVGTAHGMEAKLVPERGFPITFIKTGAVKNQSPVTVAKTLVRLMLAIVWSLGHLRKERAVAVVGVGGYVSFPVCVAAFLLRLPLYLQEQNVSVGIANRTLGRLARRVFLGFEKAKVYFPSNKILVTGNPLRKEFSSSFPAISSGPASLLIFGGSQGAKAVNDAVLELLPELHEKFPSVSVLHQTGEKDCERVRASYREKFPGQYEVVPFIKDMAGAYAKASFVISRSGALTVSELIQVGRPSLLVPFPRRGQNDQVDNAYYLERAGVARVVEQGEDFNGRFRRAFFEAFQDDKIRESSLRFSALRGGNALVSIGDQIENDLVGK